MRYLAFVLFCCSLGMACQPYHDIPVSVGLMRLGNFDEKYFAQAKKEIGQFYNAEVIDLGKKPLPALAFYAPRQRYRADKLIKWLLQIRPDSIDFIMGLTAADISHAKGEIADYGIMGLAYNPGRSGVVSVFRVGKGAKNQDQKAERFSKLVLHELGHNFGLAHCKESKHCLMRDACGTVKTLDSEEKTVCSACQKKLGKLLRSSG